MSSKVIDSRAGDKWTRFRDGSGMVMRDVDGKVLLVGRHMRAPVEISESSISGKTDDLSTPEAHTQLRKWGYEVRGEDVPTGRLAAPTIESPLSESRVREIVEEVLAAKQNIYSQIREWGKVEVKTDPRAAKPAPEPDWRGLLAELVKAWDSTYPLEAKLPESVLPFVNSPALAAARKALESNGGKAALSAKEAG